MKIFTYWEGIKFNLIDYCLKSFYRSGLEINIITPETVSIIDNILHPNYKRLKLVSEKTDCIRAALLYKFGGMWLDADTIVLKPFNFYISDKDINVVRWNFNKHILNGCIIVKKESPSAGMWLDKINEILKNNFRYTYNDLEGGVYLGEHMLKDVTDFIELPLKTFVPIEFPIDKDCWYKNESIAKYLAPETIAIALNLSSYNDEFKIKSVQEHMDSNTLFGSCFKYSEMLGSLIYSSYDQYDVNRRN